MENNIKTQKEIADLNIRIKALLNRLQPNNLDKALESVDSLTSKLNEALNQ